MLKVGEDILDFLNNARKIPTWISSVFSLSLCWMGSLGNVVPVGHEDTKLEKALLSEARRKNGKNDLLQYLYGIWKACVRFTLQLMLGEK